MLISFVKASLSATIKNDDLTINKWWSNNQKMYFNNQIVILPGFFIVKFWSSTMLFLTSANQKWCVYIYIHFVAHTSILGDKISCCVVIFVKHPYRGANRIFGPISKSHWHHLLLVARPLPFLRWGAVCCGIVWNAPWMSNESSWTWTWWNLWWS